MPQIEKRKDGYALVKCFPYTAAVQKIMDTAMKQLHVRAAMELAAKILKNAGFFSNMTPEHDSDSDDFDYDMIVM